MAIGIIPGIKIHITIITTIISSKKMMANITDNLSLVLNVIGQYYTKGVAMSIDIAVCTVSPYHIQLNYKLTQPDIWRHN